MKGYVFLLFVLLAFVNCGPAEFERNTRILVEGRITDHNNQSIPNVNIAVYSNRYSDYIFDATNGMYLLGFGTSKKDGTFRITSLFDKNENFSVVIDGGQKFTSYSHVSNVMDLGKDNLDFNLKTINLKPVSKFNYFIKRTSSQGTTIRFSFKYKDINCVEYYKNDVIEPELSYCFSETFSGTYLNDSYPDYSNSFLTPMGTTIEFRYVINDQPEILQTYTIDQENYEFEFSY